MPTKRELITHLLQYDTHKKSLDITQYSKLAETRFNGLGDDDEIPYAEFLNFFIEQVSAVIDVDENAEDYPHVVTLINALFSSKNNDDSLLKALKQLVAEKEFNQANLLLVGASDEPGKLAAAFISLKDRGLTTDEKTNLCKKKAGFDNVVKALNDARGIKDNIVTNQTIIDAKSSEEFVEVLKNGKYSAVEIECLKSSNTPKVLSESLKILQNLRLEQSQIESIIRKNNDADIINTIKALDHTKTNQSPLWTKESIDKIIAHPRPRFVIRALEYLTQVKGKNELKISDLTEIREDRFQHWRTDQPVMPQSKKPEIQSDSLNSKPPYFQKAVKEKLRADYRSSLQLMEYSLADLSLEYVGKREPESKAKDNLLLDFSKEYSQRYLELMEAYVSIDIDKGIPMLPVTAGQMKLHGYTSQQIIDLRPICKDYCAEVVPLLSAVFKPPLSLARSHDLDTLAMMLNDKRTDLMKRADIIKSTREEFETKTGISLSPESHQKLVEACQKMEEVVNRPDNKNLAWELGQAHFLMHDFAHMSFAQMADQLEAVGDLPKNPKDLPHPGKEERLLMEIRHRIAGDSSRAQNSPGTLGGNPLAYLNMLHKGVPGNPAAEYRNRMFFVYMCNHFANAVIKTPEMVKQLNDKMKEQIAEKNKCRLLKSDSKPTPDILNKGGNAYVLTKDGLYYFHQSTSTLKKIEKAPLEALNKAFPEGVDNLSNEQLQEITQLSGHKYETRESWALDPLFIATMQARGIDYIPAVFRYGYNAARNRDADYRSMKTEEEMAEFYSEHPNITVAEAMKESGKVLNAIHRSKLSPQEYLNQTGERLEDFNPESVIPDKAMTQQLSFGTGPALFNLKTKVEPGMQPALEQYIEDVNELGLPISAGISGTLDQSTAMAGLVGIGVAKDEDTKEKELEMVRLAYLAFMLPGGDHTAHEIMQSGTTYGLKYVSGIGSHQYILQGDSAYIQERLRELQKLRDSQLPDDVFSEENIEKVVEEFEAKIKSSEEDMKGFKERLAKAKENFPGLIAKNLSQNDYELILDKILTDPELLGQLALLEKGQSCHLAKEKINLPRTLNIIRTENGEYQLYVDAKRKLASGDKDLATDVTNGKPSFRLDVPGEYVEVTMKVDADSRSQKAYVEQVKQESELSRKLAKGSEAICATEISEVFENNDKFKQAGCHIRRMDRDPTAQALDESLYGTKRYMLVAYKDKLYFADKVNKQVVELVENKGNKENIGQIKKIFTGAPDNLSRDAQADELDLIASVTDHNQKRVSVYSPKALGSLSAVLKDLPNDPNIKNKLIRDLLNGVKAIHAAGYVHQGLNPDNLLVYQDREGNYSLKITGFADAKNQEESKAGYASSPAKFQSPEMAYYYTNPKDRSVADHGNAYYAQDSGVLGRLEIDKDKQHYPVDEQDRRQYKAPNTKNDMWALGMNIYFIEHGVIPETPEDLEKARQDPLLKALFDNDRTQRCDIEQAIALNQSNESKRQFDLRGKGQNYYIGIDLHTKQEGADDAHALGNKIADCLSTGDKSQIKAIGRETWHITVGWLENVGSEGTPIKDEDYQKIIKAIGPIIEKYNSLAFEVAGFHCSSKQNVLAELNEKTGALEALRAEIEQVIKEVTPNVAFKFAAPHILVGRSETPLSPQQLPSVKQNGQEEFHISKMSMMYYDEKKYQNATSATFSTQAKSAKLEVTPEQPQATSEEKASKLITDLSNAIEGFVGSVQTLETSVQHSKVVDPNKSTGLL
ncbi:hypothetical protein BN59_02537 [Legionella massiliensis]|uniref:Protein kinase domain-containing protein n=1 Tax=Legionella massiliensis TaxID=1034943 RepID=A0A078L2B1_9GAMM|nr:protein kinase family protein [Legionella massiliensis]CDZ78229.1 hypothetical protein BN59_02537 [Legionella massiliensis]CEE13967.1 hypothetical protein BN1094_02537 [Legionella massiliensis]